jgi:uncharacterized spore protein YtfJ
MELLDRIQDRIPLVMERVVGEPVERDGATVVPVVAVRAGGGGGSGQGEDDQHQRGEGSGGGFGIQARPVGAYVIRDGDVRFEPAVDVTRIVIGAQVVALVAFWLLRRAIRKRRRRA